jgi:hypothetical protein
MSQVVKWMPRKDPPATHSQFFFNQLWGFIVSVHYIASSVLSFLKDVYVTGTKQRTIRIQDTWFPTMATLNEGDLHN